MLEISVAEEYGVFSIESDATIEKVCKRKVEVPHMKDCKVPSGKFR